MIHENSIYECLVSHTRVSPKKHAFEYRVFMLAIDLDDFPRVSLLSQDRFNLFSIDRRDHVQAGPEKSIRENLVAWLSENSVEIPADAKIHLFTFPRVLGYSFNPVSFYYIYKPTGEPVTAVAEVTNTYREMKLYHLARPNEAGGFRHTMAKKFYVSPFSNPNDTFQFRLDQPGDTWTVHIDNLTDEKPTLLSSIRGEKRKLTAARLAWFAIKYPMISVLIIFRIHLHALFLFLKKIPHFPKSTPVTGSNNPDPSEELTVPHYSPKTPEP